MTDYTDEDFFDNLHQCSLLEDTAFTVDLLPVTEDGVPIRKLFISNLAERTTYKDLIKLFSEYGDVENCYLQRNQGNHGKSCNYAFLTFNSVEAAIRARYEERIKLHNRNLRVVPADSWHQPDNIENQYYNTKDKYKADKKQADEQCNQDYLQNDITDISIQTLNDDCLMHIFLQLPIVDRIRIERVCKRWRALSQESWRSVKRLDLSCSTWGFFPNTKRKEINTGILRKVLLRCGRFLTEINLSQFPCQLNQSTLTIVGKLCPNLQRIDVTDLTVSASGINSLTNNCRDITRFSLGSTTHICDMDLQKLFEVNPKLRYFKVAFGKICGKCLGYLPLDTMEEIVLECCTCLQRHLLSQAIAKLQNLKSLTISKCVDISGNVIQTIGTHCVNLKTLELSNVSYLIQSDDMLHITQLSNLEILKISMNIAVMDELLTNLALKCLRLTYVDISECFFVKNVGIAAIATLPKLEVLIINDLQRITDMNFPDMNNLKRFECRCCQFTDKTVTNLIGSAPQLELLDLSECRGVTNITLNKAATITISRTNNTLLKVFVGGTSVNICKFDKVSPFLQVVNVNLFRRKRFCTPFVPQ
ncbi:putative RNA-binding protein EEED8.10 [Osmia lignaria lignaria]|uniref:putative RNA-binding protein EEED8.10 n=1 Tax=Osmia lignaria lignaria TaxID=1437193 RepID=UPI0014787493|nr:F-box/LRR-repeat protein 20-like [Osmia lignaria]